MACHQYILVCTSSYQYILVHTSTYYYIPWGTQYDDVKFPKVHSSGNRSTHWYVLVHTGTETLFIWIMPYQLSDANESLLSVCQLSDANESLLSVCLVPCTWCPCSGQSPPLSDHPGVACHVRIATAISCKNQYVLVHTCLYTNKTSMYCYVLLYHSQVHSSTYQYIPVHTSMHSYWYYLVHFIQIYTCTYLFILDEPGVCQWHGTREYILQYTIPRKMVIYCIAAYTPLYAFVLTCPGVQDSKENAKLWLFT